jgi:eukaryotic-like serine/threonine-protein kinase
VSDERPQPDEDENLIGLAFRVADGEPVDWDSERLHTPDLAAELRSLRWLEQVAATATAGGTAASAPVRVPEPEAIDLSPGTTWGPLTIREKIGAGGAGDVFRAYDPQLEREVALKLWRETSIRKTTGTEARRLAKVRHPGILTVYGSGRYDGYAGMWTDMVDGRNLEEILAEHGPFDFGEACRIGIALCDALSAMHRGRLVHRDVKTTNVMREPDGRVILMDFGSVKELLGDAPEQSALVRGTPLIMAPEVLRGERVGPESDIYGLGVLLYRAVSGHYPIEAATFADLVLAHETNRSVPLRQRRPDIPSMYADLVTRALAPDPSRRPALDTIRHDLELACNPNPRSGLATFWDRLWGRRS